MSAFLANMSDMDCECAHDGIRIIYGTRIWIILYPRDIGKNIRIGDRAVGSESVTIKKRMEKG